MSIYSIIKFDPFVKVVSATFSSLKFQFLPLRLLSILCGVFWDYISILLLIIVSPTNFSIHWWFMHDPFIIMVVVKWWFYNFIIYTCISSNFTIMKSFPLSAIYLFTYLFYQHRLMDFYFIQCVINHYDYYFYAKLLQIWPLGDPFKLVLVSLTYSYPYLSMFLLSI
jgi:hypothetical protein